jgi:iron complex outermembrane receptor protein
LGGNAAYIDYKVDRLTIPQSVKDFWAANGNAGAQAGLLSVPTLVNSPKWQANANAEYRATGLVGGADLVLSGDFHYQDAYRQNDLVVPGYHTTDARIALEGLKDGRLDGAFFVRNVFDRTYRAAASSSAAGTTVKSYIYAAPRTWGVSLRYRFGN